MSIFEQNADWKNISQLFGSWNICIIFKFVRIKATISIFLFYYVALHILDIFSDIDIAQSDFLTHGLVQYIVPTFGCAQRPYMEIDVHEVFFAVVNWPNLELYGAFVCITRYFG